jgi:phosphomannomutase / phosphoglucomutase
LIKAKMKETNAVLAGEMSGHIFFADKFFGFDDAIYSGARLLEILSQTDKPLSAFLIDLPKVVNTPEIRIECPDDKKFNIVGQLTDYFKKSHKVIDIDGARVLFENGWGLVRASNTQPILVLRFEARDETSLTEIRTTIESRLKIIIETAE